MSEPDELYTLRNLFWLGNFQLAINEASGLKVGAHLATEKQEYVYRCYLALGEYRVIFNEIQDTQSTPVSLRAVKLLATVMSDPSNKEIAMLQLQEWLSDPSAASNPSLRFIAAILYMIDNNTKEALKLLNIASNMEQSALLVQLYLRIDRLDLAEKQVKAMKSADEDSTLSMLAGAWVGLSTGVLKGAADAAYVYEELIDKYGGSPLLCNGLAVSKMHQGLFEEAEAALQQALTKAPSDPDSLANLIAVSQHLQRAPEIVNRFISQLRTKAPTHSLLLSLEIYESALDRITATVKT